MHILSIFKITHLNFRAKIGHKLHNYFFWEFKKCSQRCKLRHFLVIFTQWRKCMTIDNFSNIVHFLREKPHYFLLPYCIVVIKDHFFKVKIGMIDMGGLFCLLSKIKSSMKDTSKNLMNEAVVKCKISDGSEYILTIVTFPTAIIQIIHHGWIQNHWQEKLFETIFSTLRWKVWTS